MCGFTCLIIRIKFRLFVVKALNLLYLYLWNNHFVSTIQTETLITISWQFLKYTIILSYFAPLISVYVSAFFCSFLHENTFIKCLFLNDWPEIRFSWNYPTILTFSCLSCCTVIFFSFQLLRSLLYKRINFSSGKRFILWASHYIM